MLSGIYGYIFGSDDSNDSEVSFGVATNGTTSEASIMKSEKMICGDEDDWFMVDDENARGRFSPELIPRLEVRDIDELSFASTRQTSTGEKNPTSQEIRKAEELRLAKAKNAQRAHLEKMLFENISSTTSDSFSSTSNTKTKSLKRESASSKAKSRSKKSSGKLSSGRNNDRKVNNID
ncbi:unnamed protein product [Caenorhabditis angaria]|uniref:Uncharacterized protein n=1 Tax=Caenorhabditis angaria TaxID=860376 RepID=A0A9P1I5N6_9PELO|nr:unnamed protein product [Caenorhabditis angaria]